MLPPRRALLLAAVTLALLLPAAGKKGKKRKPSFLEDDKKRNAYVDYLFERYDGNKDPALNEVEVDEANELEPLFRVHKKYDDTLPNVRQPARTSAPLFCSVLLFRGGSFS